MKKVISIGVALALLAMVIVPATVGAADPETYAKVPFAIVGEGFLMLEQVLTALTDAELLPATFSWVPDLMPILGDFVEGPLSWSVDMLGWGISLTGSILASVQGVLTAMDMDLGFDLGAFQDVFDVIACGLFQPWAPVSGTPFDPCA